MHQPRTRIRSVIVNVALRTMLMLFGVMVVGSFAYGLFVSLRSDKPQATQIITPMMVIMISFVLGWLIDKQHPRHTIALLFLIMAYSLAVAMIAAVIGDLAESLSTP